MHRRLEVVIRPELQPKERKILAAQYDRAAQKLFNKANNEPWLLHPYYNDDGERCPPPISAVGMLRQRARELRASVTR